MFCKCDGIILTKNDEIVNKRITVEILRSTMINIYKVYKQTFTNTKQFLKIKQTVADKLIGIAGKCLKPK